MRPFSEEDHGRVTAALAEAEAQSAGEIVTVVAARSDAYHDVALHYSVLAMLLVPAALAALPGGWVERLSTFAMGWNASFQRGLFMVALFVLLALAFLLVRFLFASATLRLKLTPGSTKSRRVHRRAIEIFRTSCERRTTGRTGILIYLSLAEHRAEILADRAIAEKVDPETWGEALEALIVEVKAGRPADGMIDAIRLVGEVLARHLPRQADDVNELPDRLVEL